jgi:phage gp46-like protein
MITITPDPNCADTGLFAWDSVWSNDLGAADWAKAGPGIAESWNRGGLRATHALETFVILALFTDKRCPEDHPLAKYADGDLRGYWADGLARANGEPDLGSLLWLLERTIVSEENRRWAEIFAYDALTPALTSGLAAKISTSAGILSMQNGIMLSVALYARDGNSIYERQFDLVWQQIGVKTFSA